MGRVSDGLNKIIPRDRIFPLVFAFTFNMAVYFGSRMIAGEWHHYNIESSLDALIPFWAPSVSIYLGCYVFWAANYILIARQGKQEICQFFAGDILSRIVCLGFYLLLPTTNTRPLLEAEGFWNQVVAGLYATDAADNLFPSIHCLVSWFCYIGLRGKKQIPVWYRGFSCVMAILICISTLTTKQHVILDVFGGVALAEGCFYIGKHTKIWKIYEKLFDFVNSRLFSRGGNS